MAARFGRQTFGGRQRQVECSASRARRPARLVTASERRAGAPAGGPGRGARRSSPVNRRSPKRARSAVRAAASRPTPLARRQPDAARGPRPPARARGSAPSIRSSLLNTSTCGMSPAPISSSTRSTSPMRSSRVRIGGVDHVQQQVGLARLRERRAEGRDQLVRQVADEADGVGQRPAAPAAGIDAGARSGRAWRTAGRRRRRPRRSAR